MTAPLSTKGPPAGVPESGGGNAKYIVIVVVLLAGIGGIFAWRSCSTKADQVVTIPTAVTSIASNQTPVNPKLEDIPPPPPPEVKPEGGTQTKIIYVGGPTGCDAKCVGKSPPELATALQQRAASARRCYNQALNTDPTLKGHISIAVKIASNGSVCGANVANNDMGSQQVAMCAANIFQHGSFPAPQGGCVDAIVPMSFVPQGQ
jgi:hypothetical protein